ncbi:hypothetical protein J6590_062460 [Homalodisca vitripennis]|nr:hypothetical protein J6590_062460 [Homalodisca vitripennis]
MVRKWDRMFNDGRTNVHDNNRSSRPSLVTDDSFDHLDLAPSDYHLFLHMKRELGGQRFETDDEVKTAVGLWLRLLKECSH